VARVAEHRLEVVDDAPAAAHAAGGDDDRRAGGARQVLDGAQVGGVVVDGGELFEGQRVAAGGQLAPGFAVPVLAQLRVAGGEVRRQRRVDDDVEVVPGDAGAAGRWRLRWMISSSS
jgi:hypothetical protein